MIKTENLKYRYKNASEDIVFPDINLSQGEQTLIIGKSGCGKTTLLHLLAALLKNQSGEISLINTNVDKFFGAKLDKFRGENIGIVFQTPYFIDSLNVEDNLLLVQKLSKFKKDKERILKVLEDVKLASKLKSRVFELSQGEKQRVTIARAIVNYPKLILADEPTSSLDDESCNNVINLLKKAAKKENATLVIVTHDNRLKEVFSNIIKL